MSIFRYVELLSLKRNSQIVKDNVYITDRGMYIGTSTRSFREYHNALGPNIIISDTQPTDPEIGWLWIDIS